MTGKMSIWINALFGLWCAIVRRDEIKNDVIRKICVRFKDVICRVQISAVCSRASNLPATKLDPISADLIHSLLNGPKLRKLATKFHESSLFAIKDHIRQEATLAIPMHAEVQLLFHYERNSCPLPPRIIYSSKQACFLCDLFFKILGRFVVPSTHERVYKKWVLPGAVKSIANADGDILTTQRPTRQAG